MHKKSMLYITTIALCFLVCFAGILFLQEKAEIGQTGEEEKNYHTEVMGRLEHGLASFSVDKNTGNAFISYEGGELQIEYRAKAAGMSERGVRFMLFIDGVAQPYWTSDEADAKYVHTFYFSDETDNVFSFYLVPNTGQKGDILELCIASIYYPDYKPDMKESEGYGIFHDMLENSYLIRYNASPSLISDDVAKNLISEIKIEEVIVQDKNTASDLSNDLDVALYINDQDVTNGNYYIVNEKKNRIKLKIWGTNSTDYRISFFANHCLVSKGWEDELQVRVQPGKMTVINAEIDISPLTGYDTFYILIVPCDTSQIATRKSGLAKTNSVLLVEPFDHQIEGEQQKVILEGIAGTMHCVGGSRLLLAGTRSMLLDARTLEIQKNNENTAPLLINTQADLQETSFVLLGMSPAEGYYMVEYDSDLQVKQIIDIEEMLDAKHEIISCKLTANGKKLIYNDMNGLYVFDIATGETYALSQGKLFIYNFACLEKSEDILYIGTDFAHERILGRMSMDGEKQHTVSAEHLWGELWAFDDFALIKEAELVGTEKEGMVFRYDQNEGIRSFPLTSSTENGNILVSCKGDYYSTCTKIQSDGTRYIIRIYSSEDGSMVKELPLTEKEYGEDFRLHGYLMCEDVDTIILYGTWKGHETDTWIASKNL